MQGKVLSAVPNIPTHIADNQKFPIRNVLMSVIIHQEMESFLS